MKKIMCMFVVVTILVAVIAYLLPCKNETIQISRDYSKLHEVVYCNQLPVENPGAIGIWGNDLIIADNRSHIMVICADDLSVVHQICGMGNDSGAFIRITDIEVYDNQIYALDASARRILLFDTNLVYTGYIDIDNESGVVFDRIAINDDIVYLSSYTDGIWKVENGHMKRIASVEYSGNFAQLADTILTSNMLEYKETRDAFSYVTGKSILYSIYDDRLTKVSLLPDKLTPSAMAMNKTGLYIVSSTAQAVDLFDFAGSYMKTIAIIDSSFELIPRYVEAKLSEDGTLYILQTQDCRLCVINTGAAR